MNYYNFSGGYIGADMGWEIIGKRNSRRWNWVYRYDGNRHKQTCFCI